MEGITIRDGVRIFPGLLSIAEQRALSVEIMELLAGNPLLQPRMPGSNLPFSVEQTNLGPLGWVSDRNGYRYEALHPATGRPWMPIPSILMALWHEMTGYRADPECCLINLYRAEKSRMGLHQDRDEQALDAPVLSLSLGDSALFRLGGLTRKAPTRSFRLASGDALVFGGPARSCFHGIDQIWPGTSRLIEGGGRLNLTLRRVTPPRHKGLRHAG